WDLKYVKSAETSFVAWGFPTLLGSKAFFLIFSSGNVAVRFMPSQTPPPPYGCGDFIIYFLPKNGVSKSFLVKKAHSSILSSSVLQRVAWNSSETAFVYCAERTYKAAGKAWDVTDSESSAGNAAEGRSPWEARHTFGEAMKDFSSV